MPAHPFPRARYLALAWLAVYVPTYWHAYGLVNFLFLCNLGVLLTALALWRGEALLLSTQAVGAPLVCGTWMLDAGWRLLSGHHLIGGTEYMWDAQYPLFQRLLSLYHVAWPFVLLAALRRTGYDRRAWGAQAALAAVAILASRLTEPRLNINFAWVDPILHRAFEPAWLHLLIVTGALAGVAYGLTHAALCLAFRPPPPATHPSS